MKNSCLKRAKSDILFIARFTEITLIDFLFTCMLIRGRLPLASHTRHTCSGGHDTQVDMITGKCLSKTCRYSGGESCHMDI